MHRYSFPRAPVAKSAAIVGGAGNYRFTVLTDGLLRYEWAPDGIFEDRASVLAINRDFPVPEFQVKESSGQLEIITKRFHLTYNLSDFSPNGLNARVKGFYSLHGSVWRYGENYDQHNLGGTARTLDEADGRIPVGCGVISRGGFATFDDSSSMLFDEQGRIAVRHPGPGRIDGYLFAYQWDYREALKTFFVLSGPQPLLPRWALGNWWSRYYKYTAEEYLALMDRFATSRVPLSVAVLDMDWHIVDAECVTKAGVTGWTGYTWNKALFPDPPAFLDALHERNLKVALNDHPADGVQPYEEPHADMAKALNVGVNDPIPFDITNQAFLDASFDILHRRFEDQGVDLWWVDWQQGKYSRIAGIDPLWVLNHFHFLDSKLKNQRPLTFSRYAGPGSHRYPIGFSGDTCITWASLNFQPEFTATASNIGFGWWSHDIGGHFHGHRDEELLIRWVQYGVFSPIFRLHSSSNPWNPKEPWNVRDEAIMTDCLRFRHRLIPYIYSMNVRAALEGEPLVQPLYWSYPDNENAYRYRNQYYFGTELLVTPITSPQDIHSRTAQADGWLPPGRYVDIFNGMIYDGNRKINVNRSLAEYPVFAREGAIIPLDGELEPGNGGFKPDSIEVLLVVGADGRFELVEDDETGKEVRDVDFTRTVMSFSQATGELSIFPKTENPNSLSSPSSTIAATTLRGTRSWAVRLLGCSSQEAIQLFVDGVESAPDAISKERTPTGLRISLGTHSVQSGLTVKLGPSPQLDTLWPAHRIKTLVKDAQIDLDLKSEIWAVVSEKGKPLNIILSDLYALGLDAKVLSSIQECLLADCVGCLG